ncbi:MAG: GNAT family N-acetyltransferase [Acidimicrobiales bacterium]
MASPDIRLAAPDDLARVRKVVRAAYGRWLKQMDQPPAPLKRDYRQAIVDQLLWVVGEPLLGLVSLVDSDDALLVENVAVHPEAQGSGLGRALMDFAEHEAHRRGFIRTRLYTNEVMIENLEIYSHLGYHETCRSTEGGYRRVHMEKLVGGQPRNVPT